MPYNHTNYREILIEAMQDKAWGPFQAIEYMNPKYNSDEEVILIGIKAMSETSGQMLSGEGASKYFWTYVNKKLKKNKSFIIKALKLGLTSIIDKNVVFDEEVKKIHGEMVGKDFKRLFLD